LVERTNLPNVAVPPQFLHPYPTGLQLKNTRECPERFVECLGVGKEWSEWNHVSFFILYNDFFAYN
jgi:hypothetical protein